MARLNEIPVAAESVESLKRRFVRQNRDLARSNSTQSIKIRALETEISGLLGENVSLRQQNIQLQTELENSRNRDIASNADAVKMRLEAKLQEFHGLLAELGNLNKKHRRRTSHVPSSQVSPKSRVAKPASAAPATAIGQEGRLPTIVEDKYYPRKTMEANEIQQLMCDTPSDSPDIGPPPRTFFDWEDPDTLHPMASKNKEVVRPLWDDNVRLLSANFDTRRRRRETHVRSDFAPPPMSESSPAKDPSFIKDQMPQPGQNLRAGIKRKLDVRDLKDGGFSSKEDNFTFSRKDEPSTWRTQDMSRDATRPAAIKSMQNESPNLEELGGRLYSQTSPVRRVLGPKSVNADPVVSPRKKSQSAEDGVKSDVVEKRPPTKPFNKPRSRDQNQNPSAFLISPDSETVLKTVEIQQSDVVKLEPKTPGLIGVLSPISTQPSEARPESKDTPPPPDLGSRNVGGGDAANAGRGSRRGRSNVSYAEPSLNSKMRRPTKDLVDAVAREDARSVGIHRNHDHVKQEETSEPVQNPAMRTVVITKDDSYGNGRKLYPEQTSPLVTKDIEERIKALAPPVERITSRERRRSTMHIPSGEGIRPVSKQSVSSTTISTLMGGTRKRPDKVQDRLDNELLETAMEKLDIYNVEDSSPATSSETASKEDTKRISRPSAANLTISTTNSGSITAKSSSRLSRASSRRQTLGAGASKPSVESQTAGTGSKDKEIKTVRSSAALSNASTEASVAGRAERIAARRRSMML